MSGFIAEKVENVPNVERIALWEQALRNPELVQGRNMLALRSGDGPWRQCCLDVACRVAMEHGVELAEVYESYKGGESRGYKVGDGRVFDRQFNILPPVVRDWFGFTNVWVMLNYPRHGNHLSATELNDDEMLTFPEIADLIRDTYLIPAEVPDGE